MKKRAIVVGMLLVSGCLRNPVSNRRQTRIISEEAERQIGRETRAQIVEEYGELKDPVLREYVSALGKKISAMCDRPRLDYEFTVLDADMVNAFAAPGGFIFVTRGLLERVDSEAELAVVLGHEIGHVSAWHSVNMIQKQMGYGVLTALGAIATGVAAGPEAMVMVAQTANLFTQLYLLGYSRENEMESDRLGARYAISAGYDPTAALSFFNKLKALEEKQGPDEWESYLRSHPVTADRTVTVRRYLDHLGLARQTFTEGREIYQEMKLRLPRLAQEERGLVEGQVFVQPAWGLSMEIPPGWVWEDQNQTLAVFRYPHNDVWGELRRRKMERPGTPEEFAERVAQERRWTFIRGRGVLYPAGYGYMGQFYGSGVLGGLYQLKVLFLVRGKAGYMLLCAAPPDKFTDYLLAFEQILRSLKLD